MDANYVFQCGMIWAQFGREDAGLEVIRALASPDQNMRVLARALLGQTPASKELLAQALADQRISAEMARVCGFGSCLDFPLSTWHTEVWFQHASA